MSIVIKLLYSYYVVSVVSSWLIFKKKDKMILLIDNYDSFVHNLARYLEKLGQSTVVVRNDAIDIPSIRQLRPQAIVLSPGPCTPRQAGCSIEVMKELHKNIPLLGVCLGHQVVAAALGGRVVQASEPMHGRTSPITHDSTPLFAKLPQTFNACRYHSLVVQAESLPSTLKITARSSDGTIMALEHVSFPVFGVQFHPEAILTEHGYQLLENFLTLAGCQASDNVEQLAATERFKPAEKLQRTLCEPVSF